MERIRCDKSVNAAEFLQILLKELIPSIEKRFHDKNFADFCVSTWQWRSNTTKVTKHFMVHNSIKTMFDPGQSVELNPIENWAHIEGKLGIFKHY